MNFCLVTFIRKSISIFIYIPASIRKNRFYRCILYKFKTSVQISIHSTFPPNILQVFRVFYDRLVDDSDRNWLFNYVREVCKTCLREDFDQLFIHLDFDNDGKVMEDDLRSLVYCDFADPKSDAKHYVEVRDLEQLRVTVEGYLDEFNNMSKKPMNLVLFR